jgi:Delta7-sterol 5-desaturase
MPTYCDFSFDCVFQFGKYQAFMNFIRYYPIAGLAFFIFYIWKKDYFSKFRIQEKYPKADKIINEIKQSAVTLIIFTLIGTTIFTLNKLGIIKTLVYRDPTQFGGVPYMIFSFIVLTIWHETYFYWLHRIMHHKKIYSYIHKVHHESVNPSPIAAYHFHFIEGFFEAIYLPIFLLTVPMYFPVFIFHTFYAMVLNIWWHLGYELFPKGFTTHPILKWISTSTHHNMHHQKFNGNYGLYFNFWDRIMGTNFENYDAYYTSIIDKRELAITEKADGKVLI